MNLSDSPDFGEEDRRPLSRDDPKKEDGEDISKMEDIQKLPSGLEREVIENLFNAIFKPWWKVW
jgi:hypothetical protein